MDSNINRGEGRRFSEIQVHSGVYKDYCIHGSKLNRPDTMSGRIQIYVDKRGLGIFSSIIIGYNIVYDLSGRNIQYIGWKYFMYDLSSGNKFNSRKFLMHGVLRCNTGFNCGWSLPRFVPGRIYSCWFNI